MASIFLIYSRLLGNNLSIPKVLFYLLITGLLDKHFSVDRPCHYFCSSSLFANLRWLCSSLLYLAGCTCRVLGRNLCQTLEWKHCLLWCWIPDPASSNEHHLSVYECSNNIRSLYRNVDLQSVISNTSRVRKRQRTRWLLWEAVFAKVLIWGLVFCLVHI